MVFFIDLKFGALVSVQMDSQSWDSHERFVDVNEFVAHLSVWSFVDYSSGNSQISVHPGWPLSTAVAFNADLHKTLFLDFTVWLDSDARGVGVRADNRKSTVFCWVEFSADRERHQTGLVSEHEVFTALFELPSFLGGFFEFDVKSR